MPLVVLPRTFGSSWRNCVTVLLLLAVRFCSVFGPMVLSEVRLEVHLKAFWEHRFKYFPASSAFGSTFGTTCDGTFGSTFGGTCDTSERRLVPAVL